MTWRVQVRSRANVDIKDAAAWYEAELDGLGSNFLGEVRAALRGLTHSPHRYAEIAPGVRRVLIRRFPYSVYFRILDYDVIVLAVLHERSSATVAP